MAHLRFTPLDYAALVLACREVPFTGPYERFRSGLAAALRGAAPALAARVSGMSPRELRLLRAHLEAAEGAAAEPPAPRPACDLSHSEWRKLSGAFALLGPRDWPAEASRRGLLAAVAEGDRALAKKLARLDLGQLTALWDRLKAGRRWCP